MKFLLLDHLTQSIRRYPFCFFHFVGIEAKAGQLGVHARPPEIDHRVFTLELPQIMDLIRKHQDSHLFAKLADSGRSGVLPRKNRSPDRSPFAGHGDTAFAAALNEKFTLGTDNPDVDDEMVLAAGQLIVGGPAQPLAGLFALLVEYVPVFPHDRLSFTPSPAKAAREPVGYPQ